ncbi:MAG TPA: hypothetical protein VG650_05985 [Mycobacteriales bacterium]|nr:hypothetical protein [Mycobacteriales bacterium]
MTAAPLHVEASDDGDRRHRALWLWLCVIAVLIAGLLLAIARISGCSGDGCAARRPAGGAPKTQAGEGATRAIKANTHVLAGAPSASIEVSGVDPAELAPGITSPLVVIVTNTGALRARITAASVAVGDASSRCTAAESIRTTAYDASIAGAATYLLPPHRTARIPLSISMLDSARNQDACKNARFPLTFHATAQQG